MSQNTEIAVFGGGCFWCTEAVFTSVKGVVSVAPGYAGGRRPNPSYEQVCTGATGHAEVVKIEFDPAQVSYRDLLAIFFATHDPTTVNQQGHDVGTQYRSIILYTTEQQKREAEAIIQELAKADIFPAAIVTEIKPLETFYEAEPYHHRYYENNPGQPYCHIVIDPKVAKFRKQFSNLLRKN